MNRVWSLLAFSLLLLWSRGVAAQNGLFAARKEEFLTVPISSSQVVRGVQVSVKGFAFLALKAMGDQLRLNVRGVVDLSGLQGKIGDLVDTIPLPQNHCAQFDTVNIVAKIWRKQINIEGEVASLVMNGDVDGWVCSEAPVCSDTSWNGWIPQIRFFACPPAQVLNQPFDATLPFTVVVTGQKTASVRLGNPSVNLGGRLGGVTGGILNIAGVDLNSLVQEALNGAINPELLNGALPDELLKLDPVVTQAGLFSNSGALAGSLELNVPLDDRTLAAVLQALLSLPK